jgi:hypothetical protein
MENKEIDAALLLEGELKRRVKEIVTAQIEEVLIRHVGGIIRQEKESLVMEVAMAVGKIVRLAEEEGRKPLWQSTPEEFGMTQEDVNRSSIRRLTEIPQEYTNAIRKQT